MHKELASESVGITLFCVTTVKCCLSAQRISFNIGIHWNFVNFINDQRYMVVERTFDTVLSPASALLLKVQGRVLASASELRQLCKRSLLL